MQVKLKKNNVSYNDYFQIIENKTAFFFSCCSALGSMIAESSSKETTKFRNFGLNYGMAFQIIDDTLDLQADKRILGKDTGNDCEGGKKTLPIIRTLEIASAKDMKTLEECFSAGESIEKVISVIERYDGIEYSKKIAKSYADKAINSLQNINGNKEIEMMKELASSVVDRSF